ncbi:MAG: ABC transporter substrate-binding protein [Rhodospirillales bacterium]|nr:ABC transporter substrate-binding protein [Rhodospirillales bacterium]
MSRKTPGTARRGCKLVILAVAMVITTLIVTDTDVSAARYQEAPMLADQVAAGTLPPVDDRLPQTPAVADFSAPGMMPGRYGGELRTLVSQPKDTRMMVVWGYARLVGYDRNWNLVPDLLAGLDVQEDRIFTLHLRKGHRWSDGAPFTAEDFLFYWEDIANNHELSPGGPDRFLLVDGQPPRFEVLDATTVRYTWAKPNPFFLPALAGARPEYIFAPAHTLKALHPRYRDESELQALAKAAGRRNWQAMFNLASEPYRNDDPDLPTLEPWKLETRPPTSRFVFTRNPYFHRVDPEGRQLPYIDSVSMTVASAALIPAKSAAGDADLQARGLGFENYTVLKQGEKRNGFHVRLWRSARGSELALYPDLTIDDPGWRALLRDVRFRRALSLAIDRREINQVIYFGLASEANDTVLPQSPLYRPEYAERWTRFDLDEANRLLDEIGLTGREGSDTRLMPDGRPIEIVVETAGEEPSQIAILQLITDSWRQIGIRLLPKSEQRDVLRNRAFAGQSTMTVWYGLENALASAQTPPTELAPTSQQQLCWPKWGQYFETSGRAGLPVDDTQAESLLGLYENWIAANTIEAKRALWHRMLAIRSEFQFTIGTVRNVPQPVVVSDRLRNVPVEAIYNWEPGAFFGVYHPDTFWLNDDAASSLDDGTSFSFDDGTSSGGG